MDQLAVRLSVAFVILWGAGAAVRVVSIDPAFQARLSERPRADVLTSPGPEALQLTSLEHPLAWADLTWLAIVQEIGGPQSDAAWDRVDRWSHIATDLDRHYFTIYHSAAVNLAVWAKRADASDRILVKGAKVMPHRWEFPFLMGYNAYFLRQDFRRASDALQRAALLEGAPRFLAALAGRVRFQGGDEAGAIALLEMMVETLDGLARRDAEERLLILKSQPRLRKYDSACAQWKLEKGQQPSARELFEQRYVDEEPIDLLGYEIRLDEGCIARTEVIRVREFEAVQRLTQPGQELEIDSGDGAEGGAP